MPASGGKSRSIGRRGDVRRGLTFRVLVVVPFCVALAIQGIVCAVVLNRSAVLDQMEADAYDLFSERVASRAGYLENDMVFRWSDFDSMIEQVGEDVNRALDARGVSAASLETGDQASLDVLASVSGNLLSLAQRAEVDGVFLVLADGEESGSEDARSALYIRDSNPKVNVPNGSDLLLAACPISLGRDMGIALDSRWSATFPLAAEGDARSAFYYEPLRAAERYPDAAAVDLGYWGRPVDLGWVGTSSITYSMPVRDDEGGVAGVLGVEIRLDRVSSYFPYADLGSSGDGSYLLVVANEDDGFARDAGVAPSADVERTYEVLATTGASQSLYVEGGSFAASLDQKGRMSVEGLTGSSSAQRAAASATEIMLYDSTSPFAYEHWALVGLESEEDLFSASRSLSASLIEVFAASLGIGLAVAALAAWLSSSRLRHLMAEVRSARPEQPISFTPTGIVEVDELSESIEALGTEVALAASRLSKILRLSDRSIGAFEYNAEAGTVTVTDGFFSTLSSLGLVEAPDAEPSGSISIERFEGFMRAFEPFIEPEDDNRYLIGGACRSRWVRLVVFVDEGSSRTFGLVEDVTHEVATRRRLEHERDHDVLTGLLNRRAFEHAVTERLADDPPAFGAMLMLDLDNLKFINDTYGHDWGDHYIKAAADMISSVFEGRGFYSRISGDEFLVFIDSCADRSRAEVLFEQFRRALDTSALDTPDGRMLKVRASTGIAYYPDDAREFARLREYADFAMYLAKNSRKGELMTFDRGVYDKQSFMVNGKEELNRLLDEELVDFHFQPIVDARAGEVAAYEALMRPRVETISTPDLVLALARSQSKLYRVEHLTFFGALAAYARFDWGQGATLFVNSVATQRLSADDELSLKQRYGALLSRVVVEITESDYSREMAVYKEALAQRFGARLAIDDFGSGYNGETSLLDYRVDFVKLDMEIVRDIDTVKDRQDIARNLVSYAHDRGIRVIAEGVETEAELRELVALDVDYLQGYLIARPAPAPCDIPAQVKSLIRLLQDERSS